MSPRAHLPLALVATMLFSAGADAAPEAEAAPPAAPTDKGVLLLVTEADTPVKRLGFMPEDGGTQVEAKPSSEDLLLEMYRIKAGRYWLALVEMKNGRIVHLKQDDPETLRFDIVADAFNYVGDLYIKDVGKGIKIRTGSTNVDLIPWLARRGDAVVKDPSDEFAGFHDQRFVVSGPGASVLGALLDAPSQPDWKLEDWLAHMKQLPSREEQLEVANKILAKSDIGPLRLGMTRKEVTTLLEKMPKEDGRHVTRQRGDEFVPFTGLFGYSGQAAFLMLDYENGHVLKRVVLRAADGWFVTHAPVGDVWQDIKGFADETKD